LLRRFPRHDAVLIDTREPLPPLENLADLKYAAYRLMRGNRIAAAVPARQDADGARRLGYDFDRHAQEWREMRLAEQRDYGQAEVPHFALTDRAHGTYLRREFISAVGHSVDPVDWDDLVSRWIAQGWHQGIRTILYPIAVITTGLPWEPAADLAADWQTNRVVTGPDGRIRVIFVLQATTLSGGIRAVLELAEALDAHGLDVEIWSLEGQPTWTDIDLEVIQFVNYTALIDALVAEQAIKVATWWETAQAVWLGSVEAGVPLQYVQEFETWFYPAHPEGRAAVAASYRREFAYTTTAAFQLQELQELGLSATLIPPAFDHEIFRELPGTQRDENTLLALGRSFFQKNFAMTLAGWKGLGDRRPRLELFGFEPKIARDPRIRYHYLPSDEEVAGLYNTATCFVQTSLHEGFSLPIIEAMAAGCPVITTDSHGNRFCVDGENCIMVEQGDVEGLTRAIERIFGDAALRERLRAGGLETAKRFTWPKVVAETAEFYGRIAARDFSPKDAT
jgi:glycosyltransferase involved in cell wall biosynthesis